MLVAVCPKCRFPIWFGSLENSDVKGKCQLCELESDVSMCDKLDHEQWRDKILSDDKDYNIARNAFYMNYIAVADKMDLPGFLAEWRLLTQEDLDEGGEAVARILREESKCMIQKVLERLNHRNADAS